jgi:hypothetical protein
LVEDQKLKDGWFEVPSHPQQHYFFKHHSLCGLFKEIPSDAHHDNVPLRHCTKCKQTLNKLMAVASSITGKKLSPRQVFNLIEALDKINLTKGLSKKVVTPENVVAVLRGPTGETETIEAGRKGKLPPEKHDKKKDEK